MEKEEAKIGERVKYTSGLWVDAENNPLWGGIHGEVKGTITELKPDYMSVKVQWDNTGHNTYNYEDLELIKDDKIEIKAKTEIKLKKTNKDLLRL